jgi:hypothetical protein
MKSAFVILPVGRETMKRWGVISTAAFLLLGPWTAPGSRAALAEEKTPTQLEAEYDREPNPKKRAKLAIALADARLKELRSAYESENSGKGTEPVDKYLSALDRLEKAWKEPSGSGASKDAEIHLRQQARALENLKMSLSFNEQAPVEKAVARAAKLHEVILYSIMNPHKEPAKQ